MKPGDMLFDEFLVISYDPQTDQACILMDGRLRTLRLDCGAPNAQVLRVWFEIVDKNPASSLRAGFGPSEGFYEAWRQLKEGTQ